MNLRPTINPRFLCPSHLLGAHGEAHKHLSKWTVKRMRPGKYLTNHCFEPSNYKARHDELAAEMVRRGWNHGSPIEQPDFGYLSDWEREWKADPEAARQALMDRCPECRYMLLNQIDFLTIREARGGVRNRPRSKSQTKHEAS